MTAMTPDDDLTRPDVVDRAVQRLATAGRTRTPCPPVRDLIGPHDADLAYAVQRQLVRAQLATGRTIVGRKIGLTSAVVQQQLGVNRPDYGVLFDDMACAEFAVIDVGRLLQPKVEAEVAFVLGEDIDDTDATAQSVRSAVDYAVAALEIVDSRIAGWDISFADTVADNGSSGLFVLAARHVSLDDVEPVTVAMTMSINGTQASAGGGDACLGDPLNALAWLARTAAAVGDPLRAGQVILSGALGPMAAVTPGARIRADITGLGSVDAVLSQGSIA
jgi:2-keto-4-pentenoate hydratase